MDYDRDIVISKFATISRELGDVSVLAATSKNDVRAIAEHLVRSDNEDIILERYLEKENHNDLVAEAIQQYTHHPRHREEVIGHILDAYARGMCVDQVANAFKRDDVFTTWVAGGDDVFYDVGAAVYDIAYWTNSMDAVALVPEAIKMYHGNNLSKVLESLDYAACTTLEEQYVEIMAEEAKKFSPETLAVGIQCVGSSVICRDEDTIKYVSSVLQQYRGKKLDAIAEEINLASNQDHDVESIRAAARPYEK